jgi:hypothetical protein
MIYEYLLLTIMLTYFLFSFHFMQMAAGFKTFQHKDDSFQKEVYTP